MTIIQLNPPIPVITKNKGRGLAWLIVDYGPEHHLMWTVAINDTGELWTLPNTEVRAEKNITMGRMSCVKNEKDKIDVIFDRMQVFENNLAGLDGLIKHCQEGIEKLFERIEKLDELLGEAIEDIAIIKSKEEDSKKLFERITKVEHQHDLSRVYQEGIEKLCLRIEKVEVYTDEIKTLINTAAYQKGILDGYGIIIKELENNVENNHKRSTKGIIELFDRLGLLEAKINSVICNKTNEEVT